jgi:hypothetical protein
VEVLWEGRGWRKERMAYGLGEQELMAYSIWQEREEYLANQENHCPRTTRYERRTTNRAGPPRARKGCWQYFAFFNGARPVGASFPAESVSGWHGLCVGLSKKNGMLPVDILC